MQDSEWSGSLDPKLQALVTELSDGLGSLLRKQEPDQAGDSNHVSKRLAGILTVKDETEYWADTANNPMSQEEKEVARAFYNVLEPMSKEFRYIHLVTHTSIRMYSSHVFCISVHNDWDVRVYIL